VASCGDDCEYSIDCAIRPQLGLGGQTSFDVTLLSLNSDRIHNILRRSILCERASWTSCGVIARPCGIELALWPSRRRRRPAWSWSGRAKPACGHAAPD